MLSKTIIYKPFLSAFSPFYLTVYLTNLTDKIVSILPVVTGYQVLARHRSANG